jgi:phage anti-repressor protein/phage regulator Rha-like protein
MEELIKLSNSIKTGKPVVNAKDLYNGLGINKDFNAWIKSKIKKLRFVENQDFTLVFYDLHNKQVNLEDGKSIYRIDYVLTLNAAKNISMIYKSAKSKRVTQFLIAIEMKRGITPVELLELDEETQESEVPIFEYPNLISSVEIANVTGKNHQHVLRDIQEMCKQGEIVVVQKWTTTDTQEVMVIEHEREINQGMGRVRKYKEYLLNSIAAEVLALGYDVKRRIALVKLIKRMRIALEQKPTTIMLEAKNMSVAEVAKSLNTCSHRINQILRKHRYVRANNRPYDKYVTLGYFAYERYNPEHSAKRLLVTSTKGVPLVQELLGKTASLPEVVKEALPVLQKQESLVPAVAGEWITRLFEQEAAFNAMINYMLMCKAGKNNKIEEEKYMTALQAYHAKYIQRNPQ